MIVIKLQGGLGNQMYQYALYEQLNSLGKEVYIDDISYREKEKYNEFRDIELGCFEDVKYNLCTDQMRTRLLDDDSSLVSRVRRKLRGRKSRRVIDEEIYMPWILDSDDIYLEGYWQCQKYFEKIVDKLRKKFIFSKEYNNECAVILEKIKEDTNSVALHIRLSDYVEKSGTYGGIATEEYYRAAIDYLKSKKGELNIYLFSDEPQKAEKMLMEWGYKATAVSCNTGSDSKYDMLLQSNCNSHICANSSFSMWAAMLDSKDDKIMIRPRKLTNDKDIDIVKLKDEWSGWTFIDDKGEIYE